VHASLWVLKPLGEMKVKGSSESKVPILAEAALPGHSLWVVRGRACTLGPEESRSGVESLLMAIRVGGQQVRT